VGTVSPSASHALELTSVGNQEYETLTRVEGQSGRSRRSLVISTNSLADLIHPLSKALPAVRTTSRQESGWICLRICWAIEFQEGVRSRAAVRRMQGFEYLFINVGEESTSEKHGQHVQPGEYELTITTSASRTTMSERANAMTILSFMGVTYPYTARSSIEYSNPR